MPSSLFGRPFPMHKFREFTEYFPGKRTIKTGLFQTTAFAFSCLFRQLAKNFFSTNLHPPYVVKKLKKEENYTSHFKSFPDIISFPTSGKVGNPREQALIDLLPYCAPESSEALKEMTHVFVCSTCRIPRKNRFGSRALPRFRRTLLTNHFWTPNGLTVQQITQGNAASTIFMWIQ